MTWSEQRRIGKNGVLSSGYGIGAEGFYRRFCHRPITVPTT
jgi:hypothetical protein